MNKNDNESKNATAEDTYAGALRAPRAGVFIRFVSVFVFVVVFVLFYYSTSKNLLNIRLSEQFVV